MRKVILRCRCPLRRSVTSGLLVAVVVAGAAGTAGAQEPAPADPSDRGALRLEPCRLQADAGEADAFCGTMSVPENPADPDGRLLDLKVVVMPALEPGEDAVPLFELAGGPGIAVTEGAALYAGPLAEYRRSRPVVLVDQRGTGGSNPLRCVALEAADPLGPVYPLESVRACRVELAARADLDRYGTAIAAGDIDRVRAALGYEKLDLWALSYGTILGQTYLRLFQDRVRSAVFVGVPSLDLRTPLYHAAAAQRALDLVFHECQMDPPCNAAYPRLRSEWEAVLRRFDQAPVPMSRVDRETGVARRAEIHRGPFVEEFRGLLGTTAGQRDVPLVIHRAAAGDFEPFLSRLPKGPSPLALGLYLSIACSEGSPRIRPEEVERYTLGTFLGDYRVARERAACAEWRTVAAPASFFEPPTADVPVLVISGEMDHVTPPRFARQLCSTLPRCRVVSIPDLAHAPFDLDLWTHGDCFDRLAIDFYTRPDLDSLDVSCVATMVPPPFAYPPGLDR